jgi:hypothetical protein
MNRLKLYEKAKTFSRDQLEPILNGAAEKMLAEMKKVYAEEDDAEAAKAFGGYLSTLLGEEAKVIGEVVEDYSKDLDEYSSVRDEEESGEFPETPEAEPEVGAPTEGAAPPAEAGPDAAPEVPPDLAAELEGPPPPAAPAPAEEEEPAPPEEEKR